MKWEQTTLGRICLPTEQRDPTETPDITFRYIDIAAIDKDAKRIAAPPEISGAEAPSRARKVVKTGDVIVSTVRPNLNAVAIVPKSLDDQIASTGFCVLRANVHIAIPEFIFYRCRTNEFVSGLVGQMRGANYPAVSDGVIKRSTLSLPTLGEQRRIVELLEQADGLRRQRAEADQLADRILPALFHQMFGDPATNPKKLPRAKLGGVIVETAYGTSVSSNTNAKGIPVLRMNNISSNGKLNLEDVKHVELDAAELQRHMLEPGDLLFNRTNSRELVGKTGIWRGAMPAVAASYLIRVRVDRALVNPEFVWAWLNTGFIKSRLFEMARRAIGMANINVTELRSLPILLPPKPLQRKFVDCLDHLHADSQHRIACSVSVELLFKNMLHRAFTGQLTAKWRQAHMKELVAEMEHQARLLREVKLIGRLAK